MTVRINIRHSTADDLVAIDQIHLHAFGHDEGPEIVELVHQLLNDETAKPLLSLVAETDAGLVGHILFSKVRIEKHPATSASILAPLAVTGKFQGAGIGGTLIKDGLQQLANSGVELVFVLGHPGYYPRFGFHPAAIVGFKAPYPILEKNADAWMVQELAPDVSGQIKGKVHCCEVLDQPRYWLE